MEPVSFWPDTTGLNDFRNASTPDEVHGVALGLGANLRRYKSSIYSRFPMDHEIPKEWSRWIPQCSAPDWWRVRNVDGEPLCLVHLEAIEAGDATLGYLWLRAHASGQPLLYCPHYHLQPAVWVTPDPGIGITVSDEAEVRRLVSSMNIAPWPGPFRQVDAADPCTFKELFGGYFTAGNHYFDQFQCMALAGSVHVPGFPKTRSGRGSESAKEQPLGFRPPPEQGGGSEA
jgi:hypothetical protein